MDHGRIRDERRWNCHAWLARRRPHPAFERFVCFVDAQSASLPHKNVTKTAVKECVGETSPGFTHGELTAEAIGPNRVE
jgi:hypothetical protein